MGDATRESPIPLQAHIISPLDSYQSTTPSMKIIQIIHLRYIPWPSWALQLAYRVKPGASSSPSEDQRTGFSIDIGPLLDRSQAYTPARWKRFGRGLEEVFSAFSPKSCKNSSLRLLGMPMGMRCVYRPTAGRLSLEFDVQRC